MTTDTTTPDAPRRFEQRPIGELRRARTGAMLGGVAAGAASHFDLDVTIVRIALVVLAFVGGIGLPLYAGAWLLVPEEGTDRCMLQGLLS